MLAAFRIGDVEKHSIEVYSRCIGLTGLEIVKVDGVETLRKTKFPIWFTDQLEFDVGEKEKHHVELRYNVLSMSSRAYVDGQLYVGCLFPQVIAYNAFLLAVFASVVSTIALVATAVA